MSATLLLTEDDNVLRAGLVELFTREGYEVIEAASVREARGKLTDQVNIIVLDVTLPDGDGVSLCKSWRDQGVTQPILFLTAKGEEFDVVRGLDAGANDYVSKPFRMQELLSRLRALLRASAPARMNRGALEIDHAAMQVRRDGEALPLTLTEYRVLLKLMERPGVVPRERLLETLWDDGAKFIDDNTLSVHISRLREKIGAEHIKTVRGVGYQWED